MCHLVLLLPIFGLIVFWIWPLSISLPVYLVILMLSGLIYFALLKAMHKPVVTGREGLIGESVDVIDMLNHNGHVRYEGEIWEAYSNDSLIKGDKAIILEINGLKLKIGKEHALSHSAEIKKHCH
jgi:membrane protein implicated in regulation of membrane protease activity